MNLSGSITYTVKLPEDKLMLYLLIGRQQKFENFNTQHSCQQPLLNRETDASCLQYSSHKSSYII